MSIASEITRLQGAKSDLKDAIEGKGVTVPSATKLDGYADLVDAISQGGGTLGTKTITANGQYDASDDGYDGYSEIDVNVPNTYSASDEGKVVSSGALVAQTAHVDVTPTTSDQTIDTTTNNSIKVKGDADLVAGNIKKDVEIFGVTGSYEGGGGGLTLEDFINAAVNGQITSNGQDIAISKTTAGAIQLNGLLKSSNLKKVTIQNITGFGTDFFVGSTITEFKDLNDKLVNYSNAAFKNCASLTSFYAHELKTSYVNYANCDQMFYGCANLVELHAPKMNSARTSMFNGCSKLPYIDAAFNDIQASAFSGCTLLKTMVLRKTASLVTLANANAFNNTPAASGGSGITIYIPETFYNALGSGTNDYQSASNWSTIHARGTITWAKIEGSYYETHYADGTPLPT